MPKTIGNIHLLVSQDEAGTITIRQVHHDQDADNWLFGEVIDELAANEIAQARNLIRSLQRNLEE